jgi:hypothetical protein
MATTPEGLRRTKTSRPGEKCRNSFQVLCIVKITQIPIDLIRGRNRRTTIKKFPRPVIGAERLLQSTDGEAARRL